MKKYSFTIVRDNDQKELEYGQGFESLVECAEEAKKRQGVHHSQFDYTVSYYFEEFCGLCGGQGFTKRPHKKNKLLMVTTPCTCKGKLPVKRVELD